MSRASTRAYGPGAQGPGPIQREPSVREAAPTPSTPQQTSHHAGAASRASRKKIQKRTSVGPWDFVKSVGAGSMGQVKLAVNRYTRQPAAIKIVPKAFTLQNSSESNAVRDARVIREGALGKLMLHGNIVQLYEVYSMTSHYYLVFEYISGGQLLDYIITHGSVSEIQARKFAREIASALDYCHRNSIVHRDLKIENILISDKGSIKIIDFGLSNMFRRDDLLKTFCGSLYFAAPELLNAEPYVGPEIDVWSFGVVLYVLICGKVPFEDKSMSALHAKIKLGEVEYPHWLSPLCRDLLSRMLVVKPADRASLREVIAHPWMNKGFDQQIENHIPHRTPLELPLDDRVVQEMADMPLGDAQDIKNELEMVLASHTYMDAVEHPGGFRRADPLNSFHPLISLYFLTRERMERLGQLPAPAPKALAAGAGVAASTGTGSAALSAGSASSGTASASSSTYTGSATTVHASTGASSSTVVGAGADAGAGVGSAASAGASAAGASAAGIRIELPRSTPQTPQTPHTPTMPSRLSPVADESPEQRTMTRLRSRTQGEESRPHGLGISSPRTSNPSAAAAMAAVEEEQSHRGGFSSLLRHISLRKKGDSRTSSPAPRRNRNRSATVTQGEPPVLTVDTSATSAMSGANGASAGGNAYAHNGLGVSAAPASAGASAGARGHSRAKSTSYTDHVRTTTPTPDVPDMPSIMAPRQVFFKGFFSVQSTSNRPLVQLRSDIISVLTDLGIEFVEIKGGFSCIHGHAANSASMSPSSPRPQQTHLHGHQRQISMGTPISSPRREGSSDTSGYSSSNDSFEMGGSDMLGHVPSNLHSPVRFEIAIVKVPVLSLHGVQFKKIGGNAWQYKTIAQEILERLRL